MHASLTSGLGRPRMPTSERVLIKDIARALGNSPLAGTETSALNRRVAEEIRTHSEGCGPCGNPIGHCRFSSWGTPGALQEEIASYAAAESRARAERGQVQ
jgi:hypothetical protein